VLNVSYLLEPSQIATETILCPVPVVTELSPDHFWVGLRLERGGDNWLSETSSFVKLTLAVAPQIYMIEPRFLPAGDPTTDHVVTLL